MDQAKAQKALTPKIINRWKYLLGLDDWDITFKCVKLEDGTFGECGVEPAHKSASINIDVEKHKDATELLETVRHELLHIVHALFDSYRSSVIKSLAPNVVDVTDDIYILAAEDVVTKLENLLKRLDVDVKGRIIE